MSKGNGNRGITHIVIPICIWQDKRLTPHERILLAEIDSLDAGNDSNGCYASDLYLAKVIGVHRSTISNSLSKFRELGLIENSQSDDGRRLLKCTAQYSSRTASTVTPCGVKPMTPCGVTENIVVDNKEKEDTSWIKKYIQAWQSCFGGRPNYGRMIRAFRSIGADKDSDALLRGWNAYLSESGRFASPENFASKYLMYLPKQEVAVVDQHSD